jgi:hypothetical protein
LSSRGARQESGVEAETAQREILEGIARAHRLQNIKRASKHEKPVKMSKTRANFIVNDGKHFLMKPPDNQPEVNPKKNTKKHKEMLLNPENQVKNPKILCEEETRR